ncbi:MAG: hypothetical protein LBI78_02375 [Campylobacteraceae bacterium]|jgi:hypothetical protein|nr:hypothetical protein [Campylobacteraceae bacterium]
MEPCKNKEGLKKQKELLENVNDSGGFELNNEFVRDKDFVAGVGKKMKDFFEAAISDTSKKQTKIDIDAVSEIEASLFKEFLDIDINGFSFKLSADELRHIEKRHGISSNDARPITGEDMLHYGEIIFHPDKIAKTKTRDNRETIMFQKKLDNTYYVVEVVRTGRKELVPISMYKNKLSTPEVKTFDKQDIKWIDIKNSEVRTSASATARFTSETTPRSNNIIPQSRWARQVDNKLDSAASKIDELIQKGIDSENSLARALGKSARFIAFVDHKTKEVAAMAQDFRNGQIQIVKAASDVKNFLDKNLGKEDIASLVRALGGDADLKVLPEHLQGIYNSLRKISNDNTKALIDAGALKPEFAMENYLKRYYKAQAEEAAEFLRQSGLGQKKNFKRKDLDHSERIALGMIEDEGFIIANPYATKESRYLRPMY